MDFGKKKTKEPKAKKPEKVEEPRPGSRLRPPVECNDRNYPKRGA